VFSDAVFVGGEEHWDRGCVPFVRQPVVFAVEVETKLGVDVRVQLVASEPSLVKKEGTLPCPYQTFAVDLGLH